VFVATGLVLEPMSSWYSTVLLALAWIETTPEPLFEMITSTTRFVGSLVLLIFSSSHDDNKITTKS
jgi:hypothetical protein